MLLNHTKPITKQEEGKRAEQRLIYFPPPRFVVLYNGTEDIPDRMELKLSDAFETKNGEPELELKVQIYNINRGMNEDLKEKCPILKEYMIYVEKVREYVKLMPLEEAVDRAIEDCIRNNVLKDFLLKQRAEVFKMSIYEYDKERDFKLLREEERKYAREELRDEVREEVREEMRDAVREELRKEAREEVRRNTEQEKENAIKAIVSLCCEYGRSQEETVEKLMKNCALTEAEAQEKVQLYWNVKE